MRKEGPPPRRRYAEAEIGDYVLFPAHPGATSRALGLVVRKGPKMLQLDPRVAGNIHECKEVRRTAVEGIFLSPGEATGALNDFAQALRDHNGKATLPQYIDKWDGALNKEKDHDN